MREFSIFFWRKNDELSTEIIMYANYRDWIEGKHEVLAQRTKDKEWKEGKDRETMLHNSTLNKMRIFFNKTNNTPLFFFSQFSFTLILWEWNKQIERKRLKTKAISFLFFLLVRFICPAISDCLYRHSVNIATVQFLPKFVVIASREHWQI